MQTAYGGECAVWLFIPLKVCWKDDTRYIKMTILLTQESCHPEEWSDEGSAFNAKTDSSLP
ncbi:MAG: hypothetical protein ACYC51_09140, partial [Thermoleophilia bacterium]